MDVMSTAQIFGNVGEFIGAIAVVATLFYLASQIRTSARMTAIEARQTVLDRFSAVKANVAASPHALTAIAKAIDEGLTFEALTKAEQDVLFPVISSFGDNLYNAIRLKDEGILDDEAFEYIARSFCTFCATDAGRTWWNSQYSLYAPDTLKRFVENRINQ